MEGTASDFLLAKEMRKSTACQIGSAYIPDDCQVGVGGQREAGCGALGVEWAGYFTME